MDEELGEYEEIYVKHIWERIRAKGELESYLDFRAKKLEERINLLKEYHVFKDEDFDAPCNVSYLERSLSILKSGELETFF